MCIDPTRCEWFLDNRISIHFGEDKTKSILFASKGKIKKAPKLNIAYKIYKFLTPALRKLLRNALIQPHFDYAPPACYPNLTPKNEKQNSNHAK